MSVSQIDLTGTQVHMSTKPPQTTTTSSPPLMSKQVEMLFTVVNVVVLSELVSLLGIFTNAVTMAVLYRQGFKRTINISLMAMALSDFLSLVSLACLCVGNNPWLIDSNVPFDPIGVFYLTTGWPNTAFARVTGWITAFIAVERCLCVALPLKIHSLLTRGRCLFVIIAIYLGVIAGVVPIYFTAALDYSKFDAAKNRSIVGLSLIGINRDQIKAVALGINNVFSPFTSFGLIIICTALLVAKLNSKAKWRRSVTRDAKIIKKAARKEKISPSFVVDKQIVLVEEEYQTDPETGSPEKSKDASSAKDTKVIKLVVAISSIYIVSSIPAVIHYMWMILDSQYTVVGRQSSVHLAVAGVTFLFQATNSSVSLFVYLYMSTSFQEVFYTLVIFKSCQRRTP
ncbi:galanin-like G-protein coupled receptor npr-9 [Biomphalaria glabrata]|nr:galanin-like G-protein coupled receptor npr-9 [Biomphalaria glabrata]